MHADLGWAFKALGNLQAQAILVIDDNWPGKIEDSVLGATRRNTHRNQNSGILALFKFQKFLFRFSQHYGI